MDGSTIPYYVVEERKKLNRCIEEAPNDYEKEIYRAIRNMPVPYEKLNEILENSRDIITSKQNRKAKNRKFFATGIPIIFMILVVAIYTVPYSHIIAIEAQVRKVIIHTIKIFRI